MRFAYLCLIAVSLFISACNSDSTIEKVPVAEEIKTEQDVPEKANDGRIVISALPKVSEPNACILPITVTNGTDETVAVSMMQFKITGSGEDDSGNMFAQTVAPGGMNTARLLFPTRQCAELTEITAPSVTCMKNGTDCVADLEFVATEGLSFSRP